MKTRFLVAVLFLPTSVLAQQRSWSAEHLSTRISREELDAISARGRELAEYDAAAWHGTDAVRALTPPQGALRTFLARRQANGRWEVVFGRPSASADTFYISYRAFQDPQDDTLYAAVAVSPPQPDTGFFVRAARALDLAVQDFGRITRPYNPAVLPIEGTDNWFVYLIPAPTRFGFWPLGADVRYQISADGRTLQAKRRLHNTLIEYGPPPQQAAGSLKAVGHTAILADRPEDTDVFLVLTRKPPMPEYIASESFYFRIDLDGRITAYDRDTTNK